MLSSYTIERFMLTALSSLLLNVVLSITRTSLNTLGRPQQEMAPNNGMTDIKKALSGILFAL